jgi:hypothetical protein
MRPICAKCQQFFFPKRNGTPFVENMKGGVPYKLWMGDLWECGGCGVQVIVGVGQKPIAEHFEDNFADKVKSFGAELRINEDGR